MKLDLGLLILRLAAGGIMIYGHGLVKLQNYNDYIVKFPDLLGIGGPLSFHLVIFAEVICAGLVLLGLFTRLATVPLAFTMAVASFIAHGQDPFQKRELSLIYLLLYVALFLMGPGRFSVQQFFKISAGRWSGLLQ